MGLPGLFSKNPIVQCTDLIWMTREAMYKGCLKYLQKNKPDMCIAWFEETRDRMLRFLDEEKYPAIAIIMAKSLQPYHLENKNVVFLEHYPLSSKEVLLLTGNRPAKVCFFSSLDDAVFRLFGGNIADVMRRLGMEEDQPMESSLVSRAIVRAQKRLEKKVRDDFYVKSGEEWIERYRLEFGEG